MSPIESLIRVLRRVPTPVGCGIAGLAVCLFGSSSAYAIKPWTLVEDGYPEATGQLELESTFEFTWHSRAEHSFREFAGEEELEYGLTPDFTLRVKGSYVYTSSAEFTGLHFDAAGVEGQYFFTNPNTDPIGISVIGAVEVGERNFFGGEAFLVVQKDFDKWVVAYNLGFVTEVENFFGGSNRWTTGTLVNALGADYVLFPGVKVGAEISVESAYDEWRKYSGTTVFAGPVLNFVPTSNLWITIGVDYQVTNNREDPQYRAAAIVGYYF